MAKRSAAPVWGELERSNTKHSSATQVQDQDGMLTRRARCSQKSARLAQHMRTPKQAQRATSPINSHATSKSPVGDISAVTLVRADTTLDHSQKAGKVNMLTAAAIAHSALQHQLVLLIPPAVLASHSHCVPSLPAARRRALPGQQSQAHCATSGMMHWQPRQSC